MVRILRTGVLAIWAGVGFHLPVLAADQIDCGVLFKTAASAPVRDHVLTRVALQTFNVDCSRGLFKGMVLPAGATLSVLGSFDHLGERFVLTETDGRVVVAARAADLAPRNTESIEVFAWDTDGLALCGPATLECDLQHGLLTEVAPGAFGTAPDLWQTTSETDPKAICSKLEPGGDALCLRPIAKTVGAAVAAAFDGVAVRVVPPQMRRSTAPHPAWRSLPVRTLSDLDAMMSRSGFNGGWRGEELEPAVNTKDCGVAYSNPGAFYARIDAGLRMLVELEPTLPGQRMSLIASSSSPPEATLSGSNQRMLPATELFAHFNEPNRAIELSPPDELLHFYGVLIFRPTAVGPERAQVARVTMRVNCTEDGLPFRADSTVIDHPAFDAPLVIDAKSVIEPHGPRLIDYSYRQEYFQSQGLYSGYSMDVKTHSELFMWHHILKDVWARNPHVAARFPGRADRGLVAESLRDTVMALVVEYPARLGTEALDGGLDLPPEGGFQ